MCTAATYKTADFYFGRTLDYEFSYGDEVAVLPRNYALAFRHMGTLKAHYAIIGMAYVVGDYPLYYDGINEKGLGMAGLNFVGNAMYQEVVEGRENIAQFEFIPWILAQCASVEEAREKLDKMNLVGTQFGEQLPAAQLHTKFSFRVSASFCVSCLYSPDRSVYARKSNLFFDMLI